MAKQPIHLNFDKYSIKFSKSHHNLQFLKLYHVCGYKHAHRHGKLATVSKKKMSSIYINVNSLIFVVTFF